MRSRVSIIGAPSKLLIFVGTGDMCERQIISLQQIETIRRQIIAVAIDSNFRSPEKVAINLLCYGDESNALILEIIVVNYGEKLTTIVDKNSSCSFRHRERSAHSLSKVLPLARSNEERNHEECYVACYRNALLDLKTYVLLNKVHFKIVMYVILEING